MTDGDGSFTIARQKDKWSLVFKIAQSRYNLRILFYIKRSLGIGSVTKDNTKGQILIRDRQKIAKFILPIFDKYPLLTSKQFNYEKFKEAFYILEDSSLSKEEKDKKLFYLKSKEVDLNYISPVWNKACLPLESVNDLNNVMTKPWLVGFIEAEGSFYLVSKTATRICHGFGLTQKLDSIVLQGIKLLLHIPNDVRYKPNHNHYILDTSNSRAIENIIIYFNKTMKGMKSVEYSIWARAYTKHKGDRATQEKLSKIRDIVRKLRSKLVETSQFELFDK
jgi:LAGLIDADG endonuclease